MPNSLDVAKQRKLVEDLKRGGQNTRDAETRLKDMLDFITSVRGYGAGTAKLDHKSRQNRSESSAG
jgi:4-aminobutyrate aminotransferase-like enzyme